MHYYLVIQIYKLKNLLNLLTLKHFKNDELNVFERGKKHGHNFVYEELRRLIKQRDKRAKLMSSKFYLYILLMINKHQQLKTVFRLENNSVNSHHGLQIQMVILYRKPCLK